MIDQSINTSSTADGHDGQLSEERIGKGSKL